MTCLRKISLHHCSVWSNRNAWVFFFPSSFFYTSGESLLIIPQCLCRLICMWLISVWRSCLWSAGRNPDSSVLHNLRDVLEIEFPSPATHEKSVCDTVAPFPFQTCPFPSRLPQGAVCCVCVYIYACILLFELQVIRGRTYAAAYFSVYFHISLSLCVLFFPRGGHKFSFNWVVYRKDH